MFFEELEVLDLDGAGVVEFPRHDEAGWREAFFAGGGGLQGAFDFDTGEVLEVVEVEEGAAEFAVGDGAETRGDFARDGGGDVGVFDVAELGGGEFAGGGVFAGLEEGLGAEEGADVVGAVDAEGEGHPGSGGVEDCGCGVGGRHRVVVGGW